MGKVLSREPLYFNYVQETIKKKYDTSYSSQFNKSYSLHKNKFSLNKKIGKRRRSKKIIKWNIYLLSKLDTDDGLSWKSTLYNFINDKNFQNSYYFQNEIFFNEFEILNNPKLIHDKKNELNPILFPFDGDDLKNISNRASINDEFLCDLKLNITELSIASQLRKNPQYENKYNIQQIKKYIRIILYQLKNELHPIKIIIKKFTEIYTSILKDKINICSENNINKEKEKIIKDIQQFIELMQVALKLFYINSINYKFFISERDEFINLISYILFNQKNADKYEFYNTLYNFFNKSNEKIKEKFEEKKILFENLSPEEAGVDPKFCLNEVTEEFIEKYKKDEKINKEPRKKSKIVEHLENNENINFINTDTTSSTGTISTAKGTTDSNKINNENAHEIANIIEENNDDNNDDDNDDDIINIEKQIFKKEKFEQKNKSKSIIKRKSSTNTQINENENNKRNLSISSYKEFSESYNNCENETKLLEKLEENYDFDIAIIKETTDYKTKINNNLNIPYKKAINFIKTIKNYKAPLEKLTIIALTSINITKNVDEFWKKEESLKLKEGFLNIDADQLMSIYLYIIFNMNIPSIFTELDFIKYFTTSISKQSIIGYYYTTVSGCIDFILKTENKEALVGN